MKSVVRLLCGSPGVYIFQYSAASPDASLYRLLDEWAVPRHQCDVLQPLSVIVW